MTKSEREEKLRQRLIEMQEFENELHTKGIKYIAGVDEVGRGPLAGPVVSAAVVLPADFDVLGVDDSKKLSEKKREELFDVIMERALAVGIGIKDNHRIDEINILEATKEAMFDAVMAAGEDLNKRTKDLQSSENSNNSEQILQIEHILFDAMEMKNLDIPQTSLIKGDARSISIAAASIIAKVTRDHMMCEYALEYPAYFFENNKGYGTKAHYEGISQAGICEIHRRSFLKNLSEHI